MNKVSALDKKIERKRKKESLIEGWRKIIQKSTEGEYVEVRKPEENKGSSKCKATNENVDARSKKCKINNTTSRKDDAGCQEDVCVHAFSISHNELKSPSKPLTEESLVDTDSQGNTVNKKKKKKMNSSDKFSLHIENSIVSQCASDSLAHGSDMSSIRKKNKKKKKKKKKKKYMLESNDDCQAATGRQIDVCVEENELKSRTKPLTEESVVDTDSQGNAVKKKKMNRNDKFGLHIENSIVSQCASDSLGHGSGTSGMRKKKKKYMLQSNDDCNVIYAKVHSPEEREGFLETSAGANSANIRSIRESPHSGRYCIGSDTEENCEMNSILLNSGGRCMVSPNRYEGNRASCLSTSLSPTGSCDVLTPSGPSNSSGSLIPTLSTHSEFHSTPQSRGRNTFVSSQRGSYERNRNKKKKHKNVTANSINLVKVVHSAHISFSDRGVNLALSKSRTTYSNVSIDNSCGGRYLLPPNRYRHNRVLPLSPTGNCDVLTTSGPSNSSGSNNPTLSLSRKTSGSHSTPQSRGSNSSVSFQRRVLSNEENGSRKVNTTRTNELLATSTESPSVSGSNISGHFPSRKSDTHKRKLCNKVERRSVTEISVPSCSRELNKDNQTNSESEDLDGCYNATLNESSCEPPVCNFNETNASSPTELGNNSMGSDSDCIIEDSDCHTGSGNADNRGTTSDGSIMSPEIHNKLARQKNHFTGESDTHSSHPFGVSIPSSSKTNGIRKKTSKCTGRRNEATNVMLACEELQNCDSNMSSAERVVSVSQCHSKNSRPSSDDNLIVVSDESDEGMVLQESHNGIDKTLKIHESHTDMSEKTALSRPKHKKLSISLKKMKHCATGSVGSFPDSSLASSVKVDKFNKKPSEYSDVDTNTVQDELGCGKLISISDSDIVKPKESLDKRSRKSSVTQKRRLTRFRKSQLFASANDESDGCIKIPDKSSNSTEKVLHDVPSDGVNSNVTHGLDLERRQENHNTVKQSLQAHIEDSGVRDGSTSHLVSSEPEECSKSDHGTDVEKCSSLSDGRKKLMEKIQMILHNTTGPSHSREASENDCVSACEERVNLDEDLVAEIRQLLDDHACKLQKVENLSIDITWKCPLTHTICSFLTHSLNRQQREKLLHEGVKCSEEPFTGIEDNVIMSNWRKFCEEYTILSPAPFVDLHRSGLDVEQRTKFVQYIGRSLDNRTLFSIYRRFRYLMATNRGTLFSREEDEVLQYLVTKHAVNFHTLFRICSRDPHLLSLRYVKLREEIPSSPAIPRCGLKWTLELRSKLMESILSAMDIVDLDLLREQTRQINWKRVEKLSGIPAARARNFWIKNLYTQVFLKRPSTNTMIVADVVRIFYEMKIMKAEEINWREMEEHFHGANAGYISHRFNLVQMKFKRSQLSFRDKIVHLYKHFIREAEKQPKKYIQRLRWDASNKQLVPLT